MPTTPLLPLPDGLDITSISETPEELLVRVTSNRLVLGAQRHLLRSTVPTEESPWICPARGDGSACCFPCANSSAGWSPAHEKSLLSGFQSCLSHLPDSRPGYAWRCRRSALPPAAKAENASAPS